MENGKIAVAGQLENGTGFGSTEFHVLRPRSGITAKWLSRFVWRSDVRHAAQRNMGGAVGQQRVPEKFLADLSIPVPPSAEQQRIVERVEELFSELDAVEAALARVERNAPRTRAAVLKAACEGQLVPREADLGKPFESGGELRSRATCSRAR